MKNWPKTKIEQKFKERGITLIALIITIIVLLILAGVALATLTGDSGILSNSEKAKENTELANLKEEVSIKIMENKLQTEKTLKEKLEEIGSVTPIGEDTFYVTKGNTTLTVYENGDVVEGKALWDGKSGESPEFKEVGEVFNWYIYTPAQLKFLADYVNSGKVLTETQKEQLTKAGYNPNDVELTADTTVYLMNDLDLGARETNGEWETEANEVLEWTAIGKENTDDKKMVATFEGNGYAIKGVYINTDTKFNGIFGNSHSIKNLTIENSYIKGANCTAAIVGALRSGTIENCHNKNTTVTLITGEYNTVAGVVGQSQGTVLSCSNTGKIVANGKNEKGNSVVGGIAGITASTVKNCYNKGEIIGHGFIGGIVGNADTLTIVTNCYNTGNITGKGMCIGGIIGVSIRSTTVSNCYNTGKITTNEQRIGGIIGGANTLVIISNCYNTGEVEGMDAAGGILGMMEQNAETLLSNSKIEKCYNSGSVKARESTGGIVGDIAGENGQGTVIQCYNKGKVEGTTNVGAVIGSQANTTGLNTLNNLYYLNTVGIGAINGEDNEDNNIMSTTENITSYKRFLEWIENK